MSKISSIYSIGKSYIKSFFTKTVKKTDIAVVEKCEQAIETADSVKVSSKQVEAYYKRYEKLYSQKPTVTTVKSNVTNVTPEKELPSELEKILQKECDAYNSIRYFSVSEETLKTLANNFEEKKQKVVGLILAHSKDLPKEYIQEIKNIKTPNELSTVIRSFFYLISQIFDKKYPTVIQDIKNKKKVSLKLQQEIVKDEINLCNTYFEMVKAVTEESKDPKVRKIENYLKTMYGMNYVHLDSVEEAKRVLKTIKLAIKNNIPLPQNIIISSLTPNLANGVNITHSASNHSIIIRSRKEITDSMKKAYEQLKSSKSKAIVESLKAQDARWFATDDELHVYTHEFCHSKFYMDLLLNERIKDMPKEFLNTVHKLGIYSASSKNEAVVELKTKSILRSLNKDEQEILAYFE